MPKLEFLAKAISVIFLPPLVALWLFIIFAFYSPVGIGALTPLYSLFIGITFFTILPLITLVQLTKHRAPTFAVPRSSRSFAYAIAICEYFIGTFIFFLCDSKIFYVIGLICLFTIAALTSINFFSKISVHVAGISGPVTFCLYMFGLTIWFVPLIAFVILVIWARWHLQAHTLLQLIGGMLVAGIISYILCVVYFG